MRTSNPSTRRILRSTLAVVDMTARSTLRIHSSANEIGKYIQILITQGSEDIMSATRKDQQLFWFVGGGIASQNILGRLTIRQSLTAKCWAEPQPLRDLN